MREYCGRYEGVLWWVLGSIVVGIREYAIRYEEYADMYLLAVCRS